MKVVYTQRMKPVLTLLACALVLLLGACTSDPEAGEPLKLTEQVTVGAFKKLAPTALTWNDLMPVDYQPSYQAFPWEVEDSETMMEETLQTTPLVEDLDGQEVKVSGYVVPLVSDETTISEFLLVPFRGACVHVPPPPANQIVYVKPTYPLLAEESWDIVSVVGVLSAGGRTSEYGAAGYEMENALLTEFDADEYAGISQMPVVVDGDGVQPPVREAE